MTSTKTVPLKNFPPKYVRFAPRIGRKRSAHFQCLCEYRQYLDSRTCVSDHSESTSETTFVQIRINYMIRGIRITLVLHLYYNYIDYIGQVILPHLCDVPIFGTRYPQYTPQSLSFSFLTLSILLKGRIFLQSTPKCATKSPQPTLYALIFSALLLYVKPKSIV